MNVSIIEFISILTWGVSIILYILNILSPVGCAIFALFVSAFQIWTVIKIDDRRISYSSALLFYTIATQFGLVIPYILVGRETFHSYKDYTLRFMQSPYLCRAIMIGIIAVTSMHLGIMMTRRKKQLRNIDIEQFDLKPQNAKRMYIAGSILLTLVLLYFFYNIFIGGMRLISTYQAYRESSAFNSGLYSFVLIMFYVGTIYLAASGRVFDHKLGWGLWLIIVFIFALNGNKGEFMYALLAVVGMKGIEGKKIDLKMSVSLGLILFIIIPGITSLRNIGILGNFRNADIEFFDAFGEMGMQIRMSIYSLQDIADGKYGYLYGRSYWQPILNIVTPFLNHSTATTSIRVLYPGHGYSQVIESYINFKIIGVISYFAILGWIVGKKECDVHDRGQLAYLGTVVCVFINATRNYFAFVPGHLILITIIYILIRGMKISLRK